MSTRKFAVCAAALGLALGMGAANADTPHLGTPISPADLAPWEITIYPDGTGLPEGSGTAKEGAPVFQQKCSVCHGEKGVGGIAAAVTAKGPRAHVTWPGDKTIGNFWPVSTTVYDFVRRAMPYDKPGTLSNTEVYQLTAYLLYLNKVIGESDRMDAKTLPKVKMPNHGNFIIRFPNLIWSNATTQLNCPDPLCEKNARAPGR